MLELIIFPSFQWEFHFSCFSLLSREFPELLQSALCFGLITPRVYVTGFGQLLLLLSNPSLENITDENVEIFTKRFFRLKYSSDINVQLSQQGLILSHFKEGGKAEGKCSPREQLSSEVQVLVLLAETSLMSTSSINIHHVTNTNKINN